MKTAGIALVAIAAVNALGGGACPPTPKPGDPLRGLTPEEMDRFLRGREVFERRFTPETGLGPLFNADACAECHEDPGVGGTGDEIETHFTMMRSDGFCDPLVERGGPVLQQLATPALRAALGIEREPVAEGAERAFRTTPDLLGFGLLDAVPESAILGLADPDDRNRDGVSGRPNRFFDGRLGRFGRKALVPTLSEFNTGAFVFEQGITSPALPSEESVGGQPTPPGVDPVTEPEINQQDLDLADAFVRFLAPPTRLPLDWEAERGRLVFGSLGCASCHVPSLPTGPHTVHALSRRTVEAYTDLLLHDMGPERADICLGLATAAEFRTEPLMGLRLMRSFLHDGKAKSIEEAIQLHGGEGSRARERFARLSPERRAALLRFLACL